MKIVSVVMALVILSGCAATPYSTIKVGPDRYSVSGTDPNQVKGNAFKACKDDGFDDYSVVESGKQGMTVHCEKNEKSMMSKAGDAAVQGWEYVKQKVEDYSNKPAEPAASK